MDFDPSSATPDDEVPPSALANIGHGALGGAELAGSFVGNIPIGVANAGIDLASRVLGYGQNKPIPTIPVGKAGRDVLTAAGKLVPGTPNGLDISDAELRQLDPSGRIPIEQLRAQYAQEQRQSIPEMLKNSGTNLGSVAGNAMDVAGDVGAVAPAVGLGGKIIGRMFDDGLTPAKVIPDWKARGFRSPDEAAAYASGFRNAAGQPVAAAAAGEQARKILTNNNSDVGNVIAHHASGVPHDTPLSFQALDEATKPMDAVYDRAAQGVEPGPLDTQARVEIGKAGPPRMTSGSPDVAKRVGELRSQMLDPDANFTGEQVVNELKELRREGFSGIASEDADKIALGRQQLAMADALEGYLQRSISPNSGTSLQQLQAARQALAQNYAVAETLRGHDMDLAALGRMYRASPEQFSGGLEVAAKFAEDNGSVVGRRIKADDTALRVQSAGRFNVLEPGTYIRAAKVTGIPQRALVADGGAPAALRMYPGRDPNAFNPLPLRLTPTAGRVGQPPVQSQMSLPQAPPPAPPVLQSPPGRPLEEYQRPLPF